MCLARDAPSCCRTWCWVSGPHRLARTFDASLSLRCYDSFPIVTSYWLSLASLPRVPHRAPSIEWQRWPRVSCSPIAKIDHGGPLTIITAPVRSNLPQPPHSMSVTHPSAAARSIIDNLSHSAEPDNEQYEQLHALNREDASRALTRTKVLFRRNN